MLRIGIIGYGSFGQFVHTLAEQYFPEATVSVFSRSRSDDTVFRSLSDVAQSDVVLLCVPIAAYKDWLEKVVPLLGPQTILVDVATVKEYTVGLLQSYSNLRFIATHPMFGPYSYEKKGKTLTGLRLVVAAHTLTNEELQRFTALVTTVGLTLLTMTPESHDRMLAETLFLTHYLGQAVIAGGFRRTDIDTVSFGFLMDAVESVQNDTALFRDVYRYNQYCDEVITRFEKAEAALHALIGRAA